MKKAFSYQRIGAYLIDVLILSVILSLLTFWIPQSEKYKKAVEDEEKLIEKYANEEITEDELSEAYFNDRFIIEKETIIISVVSVILSIGYFGTFAYINNGQTLGKKLLGIKVSSSKKELTNYDFIIRSLLINDGLSSIISIIFLLFITGGMYSYTVFVVETLQSIFVILSALFVVFRKDKLGLHDLICKTEVVQFR
ncbi:MAG: RDD family protein [Bacilli bacterium]|nr:RDD family protein [Bacilli bacterium]